MRSSNTKRLGDILGEIRTEQKWDDGLLKVRIFAIWDELMCNLTIPPLPLEEASRLTLSKQLRDGVLTCRISSSVLRTQIQFQIPSLLRRLNAAAGGHHVNRIVLL